MEEKLEWDGHTLFMNFMFELCNMEGRTLSNFDSPLFLDLKFLLDTFSIF